MRGVDERRLMVRDPSGHEHDPLAQQGGNDVEAALAPVRLLDDDGDEGVDDVGVVHVGENPVYRVAPATSGESDKGSSPKRSSARRGPRGNRRAAKSARRPASGA